MATLVENEVRVAGNTIEREAVEHNSQISERFMQLMNAEETQLEQSFSKVENSAYNFSTPTIEKPATQTPTHTRVESDLFTPATLEKTIAREAQRQVVSVAPAVITAPSKEVEAYTFSRAAKMVAAAFAVLVITLLAIIGMNSQTISMKRIKIRQLEEKHQQLVEENNELSARLEEVTSFEFIKAWGEENGYVFE